MPLYEYRCDNCGQRFEVLQKFSDAPLAIHEACGGGPVERLISPPAFSFKGSGWYVNDYASKGNGAKEEGGSAKGETKTEGKSESKTESKSESKTESKPAPSATPAAPSSSSSSSSDSKS